MARRSFVIAVLAVVVAAGLSACRTTGSEVSIDPQQQLIGVWVCKDLSKIENVSHFAEYVMEFRADHTTVSYLVAAGGGSAPSTPEPYSIEGDIIRMDGGAAAWRFKITSNTLTMESVKAVAPEDLGAVLRFHRRS